MEPTKYTKREFLKLSALGSLGIFFMNFYSIDSFNDPDFILLSKKDKRYDEFRRGFNKRLDQYPQFIAICQNEIGVQKAVKFAKENKLKITIKSGGHSFEGFSNNNNGLMINLSLMKNINWINKENVVLEPGCLLQEIYDDFLPKKRILPAGSCGTVGIAGLTLGGGYGFFSRKYGLTCDNLYRIKMVDASGKLLDSDQDKDLLWACKGGGNGNFGVVTALYFKTYQAPDLFHAHRLKFQNLSFDSFQDVLKKWFSISEKLPSEAFSAFVMNGKTLTILFTHFQKSDQSFSEHFKELLKLSKDYKPMPNYKLATALKRYYGEKNPVYFKNASAGLYSGFDDIKNVLKSIYNQVIEHPGTIYQINTLGGKINELKSSDTAYPHRNKLYLSELQAYWSQTLQEKKLVDNFENIQKIIRENNVTAQYRNYPDINFPHANESYFEGNLEKLKKLKQKYDPQNVFDYPQVIS